MLDLARGHPPLALHQELNLKDGEGTSLHLACAPFELVERSAKAKWHRRRPGGKVGAPLCTSQHSDSKAPTPRSRQGRIRQTLGSRLITHAPLPSVLPSVKTAEGAPFQPPRPPGTVRALRLCEPEVRIFQGRAGPLVWALA